MALKASVTWSHPSRSPNSVCLSPPAFLESSVGAAVVCFAPVTPCGFGPLFPSFPQAPAGGELLWEGAWSGNKVLITNPGLRSQPQPPGHRGAGPILSPFCRLGTSPKSPQAAHTLPGGGHPVSLLETWYVALSSLLHELGRDVARGPALGRVGLPKAQSPTFPGSAPCWARLVFSASLPLRPRPSTVSGPAPVGVILKHHRLLTDQ